MNPDEAQSALSGVRSAERRLAERVGHCPPWRHAAFGAMLAVLVGTIAISTTAQIVGTGLVLCMIAWLVRSDRKRYGVFINGYRRGATLPLTLAYVGVMIVLVFAAMHMRIHAFTLGSKLGLAAIAFALATAMSVAWGRAFHRELTGSAR